MKTKALEDTAANYYIVLAENKKLHNEVQELKGDFFFPFSNMLYTGIFLFTLLDYIYFLIVL